jgi:hypothetical protein
VENGKKWDLNLNKGEEKQIDFSGYFTSENIDHNLIIQLGFVDNDNVFVKQIEKNFPIKISQPGLALGLKVNGSFLDHLNQSFGDTISISIAYKNISQEEILEPSFKMNLTPSSVLQIKINDNWRWQRGDNIISLDDTKTEIEGDTEKIVFSSPEVSEIKPEEEGEIDFNFTIKNYEDLIKDKPQNLKINLLAEASAQIFRSQAVIFNVRSNQIDINVNSQVKLDAEGRYFSDEGMKIGSGPLPPQVGQETTYFIYLRPINYNNLLNNIIISADLPPAVEWLGEKKVSEGNLSLDQTNKKISWQINSLPSYSGGSFSFVEASFKISLTPSQANQGKLMDLLKNINLTATDGLDGSQISIKTDDLTTDLVNDDLGKGNGLVQ